MALRRACHGGATLHPRPALVVCVDWTAAKQSGDHIRGEGREGSPPGAPRRGRSPPAHLSGSAAAPPCGPAAAPCGRSSSALGRESKPSPPAPGDSSRGSLFVAEEGALWGRMQDRRSDPGSSRGRLPPGPALGPGGRALTAVNATHSPLQLGVTAGGAPGAIRVHVGAAPRELGLPVLPAHVAQRLLRDPRVPPGALGTGGHQGGSKGTSQDGVRGGGPRKAGRQEETGRELGGGGPARCPPPHWPAQSRAACAALGRPE